MASNRKPSKKKILLAIEGSGGIIHRIAQKLGCAWSTCRIWIDSYPECLKALNDETEKLLDLGEHTLIKNIKSKNEKISQRAAEYLLSTKGKKRGYTTRQEVTGAEGGDVNFNVTIRK